ncbi:hypothetical protein [Paenibacillus sp. QZ-Y1]|uniref:hypothetical protein n=1 Tax=Paenibacillus sp. QZ-Y1 TaxID=3414511 RepID=UPI003F79791F
MSLVITSILAFPLTSSANTKTISNSNYAKWQHPYSGSFEAYRYTSNGEPWVHAQTNFKYNGTQLTNMKKTSYYPTIEIKLDNPTPKLMGRSFSTTMPDPKTDTDSCKYSTFSGICEIEVASKNPNQIVGGRLYNLSTEWINDYPISNDPYLITYGSQSREPTVAECAALQCELNTVSGTAVSLAGFKVSELNSSNFVAQPFTDELMPTEELESFTDYYKQPETVYEKLQSETDLQSYANELKQEILQSQNNQEEKQFILTFKRPMSSEEILKTLNDIELTSITARAYNDLGERVTVGLLSFSEEQIRDLEKNTENFQGYIEIEGTASVETIKNLSTTEGVFGVEVSGLTTPNGLYWKYEDYIESPK